MSTATVSNLVEVPAVEKPSRRGRKPHEKEGPQVARFFMGDADDESISLQREFKSEAEAQLESLKLDRPYYTVESWKAVADLSNGSIAIEKRAVSSRT
ncbi:MAG TPA: hypothetical protein VMU57_10665 [Edaphobacter sp.]|uniref:hypothetical protein n=1 Tax=Edaphobacter sp. TaxID=1934404 RepID=UPI002C92480C|nr:hypothetical protein [Edaphobacter sp.]HUZ95365.1 hypothetical protein [Edaphobacter sp.]